MQGGGVDGADVCGALVDLGDGGLVVIGIGEIRCGAFLGAFVVDGEDVGFGGFGGSRAPGAAGGGLGGFGDEGGELGCEGEGGG